METRLNKVVVSGASGLVGSYVVRALIRQGHEGIVALRRKGSSRRLSATFESKVQWKEGDIEDPVFLDEVLQGAGYFIHAAGVVSFDPAHKEELMRINAGGTAAVVNACLRAGVRKLVHVSSVAALGRPPGVEVLDEQVEWTESPNNTPYALSKHLAELEILRGVAEGLQASMILPGTVLGVGDWTQGSVRLLDVVAKGVPFYPSGMNGFVDVRDVADLCVLMMQHPDNGGRWIACSESVSYRQLLTDIADEMGVRPPRRLAPRWLAYAYIAWDTLCSKISGKPRFLTKDSYRVGQSKFRYSNDKVRTQLDYTFIPLRQTISEAVAAYRM